MGEGAFITFIHSRTDDNAMRVNPKRFFPRYVLPVKSYCDQLENSFIGRIIDPKGGFVNEKSGI